MYTLET